MRPPRTRRDLTELYRIAIDEYRFEVRLNWDRMQYFAVVNSGIIAVGATLVKDAAAMAAYILPGLIFAVGVFMNVVGIVVIHRARDYYRQTILKKTVYEYLLGLNLPLPDFNNPNATLAIGTTQGMQEAERILNGRPPVSFLRGLVRYRVQTFFIWLLLLLAMIDVGGAAYSTWRVSMLVGTATKQTAGRSAQAPSPPASPSAITSNTAAIATNQTTTQPPPAQHISVTIAGSNATKSRP